MLEELEVDPEQIGTVLLSTLSAPYIQNNSTTKSNTYGWYVDWAKVLGEPDPSAKYEVDHIFYGAWGYLTAIPTSNMNVFQGFSTQLATAKTQNTITCTLPLDFVNNQLTGNTTNTFNMNQNNVINYVEYDYQYTVFTNAYFSFFYPNAPKKTFRCAYPGNYPFVSITAYPTNSAQHFGNATNNFATTSDYFHSGVHKFIFRRLRPKMRITRELDPEVTGQLTLMTTASNTQNFDTATQTQSYTWNNIQWDQVIGKIANPCDSVWEVTHNWESNAMASQSINTALGFPGNPQSGCPFFPVIFIGCNLQGNNSTPGVFNTINSIYSKLQGEVTTSAWYQFLINTYADPAKFVTRNPENFSTLTIVTRPSFPGTYTSNTATTSPIITSYPNDYYTNGTHIFTFRLLKQK